MRRPRSFRNPQGFSILELVVAVFVLGLIVTLGFPPLQNLIVRSRLEAAARETSILMRAARLEAIKEGTTAVVRIDTVNEMVEAFMDEDGDGDHADPERWLRRFPLQSRVDFSAPGGETVVDGFTPSGGENQAVFLPTGAVDASGAFRIGDERGNFLEVRVEPRATARVQLRKWDGTAWQAQGEGGNLWTWK